ncbi:putative RNA-binding protein [Trypanosoma rangeli]|uniref:Putative RNA-binding protein n=1 Tax=Trypanosoma rangeli TaxID=5698 RepID=A0A422MY04_TRYRA|nr:putative RNA-binding protein [Trypanosoma rangeli]RNE98077.1 putative RNA-binding protein [Trypanosoma rangeli]|eukprot:RNE98077.1 putative RNA-binding protein [Trypanosoma rangeli]
MRNLDPTAASAEDASNLSKGYRYFVGGIQRHITQQDLERYFEGFGDFETFTLKRDSAGNSRGYGWVTYRAPSLSLMRQDAHVLKGVLLTVEQARSRGPHEITRPDRRGHMNDVGPVRRRRRSRSRSRSRSLSSTSSSSMAPRRGGYRRFSSPRHDPTGGSSRLPSIAVGASRLPPLSTQLHASAPPSGAVAPVTGYEAVASTSNRDPINTMSETYLCIPMTLCPTEYLNDPRTFCARLDQNRVGSLNIVPTPLVPAAAASASISVPPPPPPPPLLAQQLDQHSSMGGRNSRNNSDLPPAQQTLHGAMQRGGAR